MKIVFVAPHSFIWPHAYPEALVADALRSQGHEILYITCGEILQNWCVPMESIGATEEIEQVEKARICSQCQNNAELIRKNFGLDKKTLADYYEREEHEPRIEDLLHSVTTDNLLSLVVDGMEIGRTAMYNYLLNHKTSTDQLTTANLPAIRLHLRSTLRAFFAGRQILKTESPDRIIFYSSSYSANLAILLQAQKQSIPCFSLYAGNNWSVRFRSLHIAKHDSFTQLKERQILWEKDFKKMPATREGLVNAKLFMKTLLKGDSIFLYGGKTQGKGLNDLRQKFAISAGQKVLFAATSSYDELAAAQVIHALPQNPEMAFQNQLQWLEATIDFVANRTDLALVIRIHPREFANKRENKSSKHAEKLIALLKNLPPNVKVNWPNDGLSLYDFLELIDLGLSAWSSAGKELAYWGIPNLTFVKDLAFYPKSDLGHVASSAQAYFESIDIALNEVFTPERIFRAYRWLAFELTEGIIDISDGIHPRAFRRRGFTERLLNKILRRTSSHEKRWMPGARAPIKNAAFISERVMTGRSVEETMLPHRPRLSRLEEANIIRKIVSELSEVRFGRRWLIDSPQSKLQRNIQDFIKYQGIIQ